MQGLLRAFVCHARCQKCHYQELFRSVGLHGDLLGDLAVQVPEAV